MQLYNTYRLYVKKYNLSVQFLLTSAICYDGSGSGGEGSPCLRMGIPYPLFHAWCKDNPQRRGFRAALVG